MKDATDRDSIALATLAAIANANAPEPASARKLPIIPPPTIAGQSRRGFIRSSASIKPLGGQSGTMLRRMLNA
jgi:hypothetical protein